MAKTIRVSVNEDVERLLEALKCEYPALDHAEILKLGLSELYRKHELETRQAWSEGLPELELTDEEAQDIAEARKEKGRIMSVDQIMAEALSD